MKRQNCEELVAYMYNISCDMDVLHPPTMHVYNSNSEDFTLEMDFTIISIVMSTTKFVGVYLQYGKP